MPRTKRGLLAHGKMALRQNTVTSEQPATQKGEFISIPRAPVPFRPPARVVTVSTRLTRDEARALATHQRPDETLSTCVRRLLVAHGEE